MPISYAVFLDIRLSLPINTLTLSAIEAAWERTQITNSTGAISGLDWDPDCWLVDAWLACPAPPSPRLNWSRQEWEKQNDQGFERNPGSRSMGRRLVVVKSDTSPAHPRLARNRRAAASYVHEGRRGNCEAGTGPGGWADRSCRSLIRRCCHHRGRK